MSIFPDLTRGEPWVLGTGRFLVITVTTSVRHIEGTVFETAEGTRIIVVPAGTRHQANAVAALAGARASILAVRPSWSFPSKEWIASSFEV